MALRVDFGKHQKLVCTQNLVSVGWGIAEEDFATNQATVKNLGAGLWARVGFTVAALNLNLEDRIRFKFE